jgi:hypothetical protein
MGKDRNVHAAEVLRRLDEIGAIKLDVLTTKASEVLGAAGVSLDDDDHGICYPFYIRIGPRSDIDLVSVASQLKLLGYDMKRTGGATAKV